MTDPASHLTLSEVDRRILARWAADCVERVLPIFEEVAPLDSRPRDAVVGAKRFGDGELRVGALRKLSVEAHAAGREVNDPAARAVARAAGHAAATAHMAAHARGVAYAALAVGLSTPRIPNAAMDELRWQIEHASSSVREVMRKLPPSRRSGGRLSALIGQLEVGFDSVNLEARRLT